MTTTALGKAETAALLIGAGTAFSNIAIGTGSSAFDTSSTNLANEYKRETATTSTETTDDTGDTAQYQYTFNFTETKSIQEVGVFNDDTAGTMLCASTMTAKNVDDGDSLQITYKVDVD